MPTDDKKCLRCGKPTGRCKQAKYCWPCLAIQNKKSYIKRYETKKDTPSKRKRKSKVEMRTAPFGETYVYAGKKFKF